MFFVANAKKSGEYRREILEGKNYLVVPAVMLVEGVFVGNQGPIYYSPTDYADSAPLWDHKPAVVYHPKDNEGNFISAGSALVMEAQRVGFILNTRSDGRLLCEVWVDEEKAKKVDERIVTAILANEPMEVSTGMTADVVEEEGEHNGIKYVGRAVNFRPDHFALLPDKKGACSLKDGAGLLVMEDGTDPVLVNEVNRRMQALITNQLSHENVREALRKSLRAILILNGSEYYPWIAEVYQTFFIAEVDGKLWKIGYSVSDDAVVIGLNEKPVEVFRVTEYKTVDGKFIGNELGEDDVKKAEMVEKLIANGGYEDSDKEMLNGFTEDKLGKLVSALESKTPVETQKTVVNNEKASTEAPAKAVAPDWDTFLKTAPPQFRQVIQKGVSVLNEQIANDMKTILNSEGNAFTEDELRHIEPEQLSKIAKVITNAKPAEVKSEDSVPLPAFYGGFDTPPSGFIANSETDDEPLEVLSSF